MEEYTTTQCQNCNKRFEIHPKFLRSKTKQGRKTPGRFCSRECAGMFKRKRILVTCENCGLELLKVPCELGSHNFCSRSCAAIYNNAHKTTGTRRSKLETYLEQQLRTEFSSLILICNGKDAIGSELDFYFPQLRLAIELNGIFHYEPIYGADKLEQIQANDQQKSLRCAANGIEFCTIDTSTVTHTTSLVKERYWTIIRNLVTPLLGRAGDTTMQVS